MVNWRFICLAVAIAGTTACSSVFELGEEPTSCPITQDPGLPCTSTRDIMKLTTSESGVEREKAKRKKEEEQGESCPDCAKGSDEQGVATQGGNQLAAYGDPMASGVAAQQAAATATNSKKQESTYPGGTPEERAAAYQAYVDANAVLPAPEPIAVRARPQYLRVSFSPWIDSKRRLQTIGYVFAEVKESEFIIGRGMFDRPARITPLDIRKASIEDERRGNPEVDRGFGLQTEEQLSLGERDQTREAILRAMPQPPANGDY